MDIITLFPEILAPYFQESILRRAQDKGKLKIVLHNLREYGEGKHRKLDERPYGGGAGMVLMAPPILRAVRDICRKVRVDRKERKIVILSAKGTQFTQRTAVRWARTLRHLILISGRYEGIDERVRIALRATEISLGPYVLTDGDVAAMAVVSSVARLIPGVICSDSLLEESHSSRTAKELGKREYPHYT
ncbi:tRNA (guanosine(37)-N1)-methyltransferase TrmD, partial [Candidatus Parcubacteria bacterium]